jgi:hypothetical protein
MTLTSLTPTSLSVPPDFGAPVPGFSPWLAESVVDADADDDADDDGPVELLLVDGELLHAAASTVRATAVAAPTARKRKCLTTQLLLQNLLGEGRPPMGIPQARASRGHCRMHLSLPAIAGVNGGMG